MKGLVPMLADGTLTYSDVQNPLTVPWVQESLMLIGAIVFVTLVIFIWAVYFRKRGRRHKHHHRSETQKAVTPPKEERPAPVKHGRRKSQHSRREHRPRNPTLAETRGLPPVRDEQTTWRSGP